MLVSVSIRGHFIDAGRSPGPRSRTVRQLREAYDRHRHERASPSRDRSVVLDRQNDGRTRANLAAVEVAAEATLQSGVELFFGWPHRGQPISGRIRRVVCSSKTMVSRCTAKIAQAVSSSHIVGVSAV